MIESWILILIAVSAAVWFFCGKIPARRLHVIIIYFWSVILAIGIIGFSIQWVIDGHMPAPCCT